MKKLTYIIGTVLLLITATSMSEAASSKPTCAVLTFENDGEASDGEAGMLSNMISVNVARSGRFTAIPRYKLNQTLNRYKFQYGSYKDATAAGKTAGRMIKADYVIFGTLLRRGDKNEAAAFLMDVSSGAVVERVQVASTGTPDSFRSLAAAGISRKLVGTGVAAKPPRKLAPVVPQPPTEPITPPKKPLIKITPVKPKPIPQQTKPEQAVDYVAAAATESRRPLSESLKNFSTKASRQAQYYWAEFTAASKGRLETGIRYRTISLNKETDDSFLGTINTLEQEEDGIPAELFATWFFNEFFGAELSWFNVRAKTVSNPDGFSDGAICVSGPTLAAVAKYPESRPWIPFAAFGLGMFSAEFDHATWWQRGYESEAQFAERGFPTERIKTRDMSLSDTTGLFFIIGLRYETDDRWSVELAYRTMSLEVDDRFTIAAPGEPLRDYGITTFPLDNSSVLLGARYSF